MVVPCVQKTASSVAVRGFEQCCGPGSVFDPYRYSGALMKIYDKIEVKGKRFQTTICHSETQLTKKVLLVPLFTYGSKKDI